MAYAWRAHAAAGASMACSQRFLKRVHVEREKMFSPKEILDIAIRIEENGYAFYQQAARKCGSQEVELFFTYLADEEANHKEVFSDLLSEFDEAATSWENHPGEHLEYLNAFADHLVFGKDAKNFDFSDEHGTEQVLQFAMRRETESILFYQEIKAYLPQTKHPIVDAIIAEERRHFTKLANLKKSIA